MPGKGQHLDELFDHVYGPYHDAAFLKAKFLPAGRVADLDQFMLKGKKSEVLGFDDTEFIHCPTPEQAALLDGPHGVDCFGKLEIKSLDWLTENGYKKLQKAVLDFDDKAHTEFSRVLKVEGFDLESWLHNCPMVLDGDRMVKRKLKVWIMFRKKLPARFLTVPKDPEAFLVQSDHGGKGRRDYNIKTIDVFTHQRSENFLERFRLKALIKYLIDTEPENAKTDIEDRDIQWIVKRYSQEFLPKFLTRAHPRVIGSEDLPPIRLAPHVPMSSIVERFAKNAEWILANQLASSSRSEHVALVSKSKWLKFVLQVRKRNRDTLVAKKSFKRSSGLGLLARGGLPESLATYGAMPDFWEKKLEALERRVHNAKKNGKTASILRTESRASPAESMMEVEFEPQNFYDSEFSEPSTPGLSDTSMDDIEEDIPPLPAALYVVPRLPDGRFDWQCPRCAYRVDLLKLTDEQLGALSPETYRVFVRGKGWKQRDEPIQLAFKQLVGMHSMVHMEQER